MEMEHLLGASVACAHEEFTRVVSETEGVCLYLVFLGHHPPLYIRDHLTVT